MKRSAALGPVIPRFVGRDAELRRVGDALRRRPALVLVEGEAGIGKSRLVREALITVAPDGMRSLVTVCPPFREALTLGAVVDAARQAVPGCADVTGLGLSALAGTLRPLFPEWADALPPSPEPLADTGSARHRLIRAFAELITRLAIDVLVVEDVHWADEVTLELLLFLASQQTLPLSLVLTYRPEEVSADSLLLRLSSRAPLGAGAGHTRVALGGLPVTDTANFVSSMLDDEHVSAAFAEFLHERTAGVPLVLEECVRLMRDRSDVVRRNGEWVRRTLDEISVPPTIRDAVTERVARLGDSAQQVLLAAAVLGQPVDEHTLGVVSGLIGAGTPGADLAVEAAVSDAVRVGLLVVDGTGTGRIAFRHVLAAKAIHDQASPADRRAAHRRTADFLETTRPRPVGRLAHHYREAGQTARWSECAEQAADIALASGDHLTAVTLLHDLVGDPALPAESVAPLVRKMPFLAFTGYARRTEAITALRAVLETDRISARDRADVRGQLSRVLSGLGDYAAAAVELELAIPDLGEFTYVDAWAMTALGLPWVGPWPAATHLRWLERAERFAAGSELAAHEHMNLLVNRVTALLELGQESGWALAEELGDDESTPQMAVERARAELNVGDSALRWGRYDEARTRLNSAVDVAERHGVQGIQVMALVTLLRLDYVTGDWHGLTARAEAWAGTSEEPVCRLEAQLLGAQVKLATAGADDQLEELLGAIREESRRRGVIGVWLESSTALAHIGARAGDAERALALTEDPLRLITDKDMWTWATEIAPVRVSALTGVGRQAEAELVAATFEQGLSGLHAPAPHAALRECQALCAEGRRNFKEAALAWSEAAKEWSQLPRPHDEARAKEGVARCTRATRGGRRGYGSDLSPREQEVVRLVLRGMTNRQIAHELSRSPSTIGVQLKSAMRKYGVSSRTALAVRVTQADGD